MPVLVCVSLCAVCLHVLFVCVYRHCVCMPAGALWFTAPLNPVQTKAWAVMEGEQRVGAESGEVCFAGHQRVGSVCLCVGRQLAAGGEMVELGGGDREPASKRQT